MDDSSKPKQEWAHQLQTRMQEKLMRPCPSVLNYFQWIDSSMERDHPFRCMPSNNLTNCHWIAPAQFVEFDNKAKTMSQEKGQKKQSLTEVGRQ